ncbi:MAG: hypothetical protein QGH42_12755 [Kiritimatiellia bacterium]|jgi:hypothetical protein|nr:hypothetical protein [Kiritimatiellia bacterium]MDP6631184.1 hypothetical protein [Kiritimatiellia bacterium]MDP6809794.1 hypothetical protein [Kiritimatiellia bacterium]MDP7025096.1 hypothetical protein [Kiritimatiellia bacterium]
MVLTDEQKAAVAEWVGEGDGLSDIQKRLSDEFDLSMTYMDVRFLIIDLDLTLKEDEPPAPEPEPEPIPEAEPVAAPEPAPGPAPGPTLEAAAAAADAEAPAAGGSISVEVDRVVKPGAVVSGSVTFSDGQQATWVLDQLGRLALDAGDKDYRPSEQDISDFQVALRDALQKQGF